MTTAEPRPTNIMARYAAHRLICEAQALQHFGKTPEDKTAMEKRLAVVIDNLERIAVEAEGMSADKCQPSPHACPKCEILHLAKEALEVMGLEPTT